jgi:hypothetical protein
LRQNSGAFTDLIGSAPIFSFLDAALSAGAGLARSGCGVLSRARLSLAALEVLAQRRC